MVCCLQGLDAAFNHDLEQQEKSSKAGNRHNGFWAKEIVLTNTWSETGCVSEYTRAAVEFLRRLRFWSFFPLLLIASGGAGGCYLQPQNLDLSSIVCNWMNSETRNAWCCAADVWYFVHGGHGYSR
jgi:hypothetical protein